MKVVVIGGGPAGMMSAISAKKSGADVVIIEKMNNLGKKLLITGKGRCNITSSVDISEFINNVPGNGRFLFSAFQNFSNKDIINFMEIHGVKVKEERGNRIFPTSDKAKDVLDAFYSELKSIGVKIITNAKATNIITEEESVKKVEYYEDNKKQVIDADKVILATGGKSYPTTGSTGDGYEIAKRLGHTVTEIKPSLIPIVASNNQNTENIYLARYGTSQNLCKYMQGLSLRNVKISFLDEEKNKVIYDDFGELLFTHFGVSGPTVLSGSAHLIRHKNIDELLKLGKITLAIDLKPALDKEKLDDRILRDFEKEKNKDFKNSLNDLLPQKMIEPIITLSRINPDKKVNEISKEERRRIVELLKSFKVRFFFHNFCTY